MNKKALFFYCQLLIILFFTLNAQEADLSKVGQQEISVMDEAQFWIQKLKNPDSLLATSQEIQERYRLNMLANFIEFKPMLKVELIEKIDFIQDYTRKNPIYDSAKQVILSKEIRTWQDHLNKEKLKDTLEAQYGIAVERSLIRNFPFYKILLKKDFNLELNRTIESALYLGEAVKIWHQSEDENWFFIQTAQLFGWIEKERIALLPYEDWKEYQENEDFIVVTDAKITTHYHPRTASFNKELEMGSKFPLWKKNIGHKINENFDSKTEERYHVISIPLRDSNGMAYFTPHLVNKNIGVNIGFIPFTEKNIIHTSFQFLGERYGWGGLHNARDCSSYIGDVYKTFGFILHRNSSEMEKDARFKHIYKLNKTFSMAVFDSIPVGSILYFSTHVMLYLGKKEETKEIFILHDSLGGYIKKTENSMSKDATAHKFVFISLLRVAVSSLQNLFGNEGNSLNDKKSFFEKLTAIIVPTFQKVSPD